MQKKNITRSQAKKLLVNTKNDEAIREIIKQQEFAKQWNGENLNDDIWTVSDGSSSFLSKNLK